MMFRTYEPGRDLEPVQRIYREVGWSTTKAHDEAVQQLFASGQGWVAEIQGDAECAVVSHEGHLRYQTRDLPLCAVTGVTTSRIARKQGLASQLTAKLLAENARQGQAMAILGIFEQGYYNQLGFGNGGYEHWVTFDPSTLEVPGKARTPIRLGPDDWPRMHEGRLRRIRGHGTCSLDAAEITHVDVLWTENGFGLGYADAQGDVSHHLWCSSKGETGPYRVGWLAFETRDEFHELMLLLRGLGEQVRSIRMREPAGIQLQDFIRQPFKMRQLTRKSPHENRMDAAAYWQIRILDLARCVSALTVDGTPVRFNLSLTDPILSYVPSDSPWIGINGEYTVHLGQESHIEAKHTAGLPLLQATVNAFSRLWLGVRPATGLSWSDDLEGPEDLLDALDRALRLPLPLPDWEF
jgi:hypothetical protein